MCRRLSVTNTHNDYTYFETLTPNTTSCLSKPSPLPSCGSLCAACKDKNQTRCGAQANCDNTGPDCSKTPSTGREFWALSPPFPTTELR